MRSVNSRLVATNRDETTMSHSFISRLANVQIFRRFLGKPFLGVNEALWNQLPAGWRASRALSTYGVFLNSLVKRRANRTQFHGTFFMRNRPEIKLICSMADQRPIGSTLKMIILACSNGAEVYSILYAIRSVRPDLTLHVHAVDISEEIVKIAREAVYSPAKTSLVCENIFERLAPYEIANMFHEENGRFRVKPWIAQGIDWRVGDAADPKLGKELGPADIVIANRFLCHMKPFAAETCLRNLMNFVKLGGYLFVSGVDLDVRTKVASELAWLPVTELLKDIHDGDPSVRRDWPWKYWGLEPLDARRSDWRTRYAAVFRIGAPSQDLTQTAESTQRLQL